MGDLFYQFALFGLSAEEAAAFDRLGSVAVLVLVLVVFIRMVRNLGDRLDKQTDALKEIVRENIKVMTTLTESNDDMVKGQTRLHERVDGFMACSAGNCPVRKLRAPKVVRPEAAATETANLNPKPATG